ncbi:C2 domain-containing protein [Baffinella frigidus]|nr:C2 domain-containing protein [Cryptophyta sp. CCMP2293]
MRRACAALTLVTLVSAANLPKMDLLSKCDPYCIFYINGTHSAAKKSSVRKNTKNPEWQETLSFRVSDSTTILTVTVWDKDKVTEDDMIGSAFVDLDNFTFGEEREVTLSLQNSLLARKIRESKVTLKVLITDAEVNPTP